MLIYSEKIQMPFKPGKGLYERKEEKNLFKKNRFKLRKY